MKDTTLVYLHVPKTAGTGMRIILMNQYQESMKQVYTLEQYEKWHSASQHQSFRCIYIHLPLYKPFYGRCEYASILRDPVDAVISFFYYLLLVPNNHLKIHSMSLREFLLSHPDTLCRLVNYQTRYIANHSKSHMAIKNIEKYFPIIGTLEKLHETIYLLSKRYGWRNVSVLPYANKNLKRPAKEAVPEELIERLEMITDEDRILYKYVQQRLDKTLASLTRAELRKIDIFKETGYLEG
ncbi:sulfotransferase family protein [Paenibacillus alkalitolerans]|uniref:sulfotransferase family 2 domain-containing protein n=1 Tax=Paenibacillus alkalitolerans TaxID=2799335 RepID=UPI0018F5D382|nr:sulfotransferase family 2 domain-containing protein [Paenibacillus alkalitolerans]